MLGGRSSSSSGPSLLPLGLVPAVSFEPEGFESSSSSPPQARTSEGRLLSPRPVLHLHPFLRAAVELLLYLGVTIAWWSMDQAVIGSVFAVVAIAAGVIAGRRTLA